MKSHITLSVAIWMLLASLGAPLAADWSFVQTVNGRLERDPNGRLRSIATRYEMSNLVAYQIDAILPPGEAFFPKLQVVNPFQGVVLAQGGSQVIFWPESNLGSYDLVVETPRTLRGMGAYHLKISTQPAVDYVFEEAGSITRAIDALAVEDPNGFYAGRGKTYCNFFVSQVTKELAKVRQYSGARPWENAILPTELAPTGTVRAWLLPYYDRREQMNAAAFTINANAMQDFLASEGAANGWEPVTWHPRGDRTRALTQVQALANRGYLVVASWKNPEGNWPPHHGHIAIVRPHAWGGAFNLQLGPRLAQAGGTNFSSGTLRQGFGPEKWNDIQYFVFRHRLMTYAPPSTP